MHASTLGRGFATTARFCHTSPLSAAVGRAPMLPVALPDLHPTSGRGCDPLRCILPKVPWLCSPNGCEFAHQTPALTHAYVARWQVVRLYPLRTILRLPRKQLDAARHTLGTPRATCNLALEHLRASSCPSSSRNIVFLISDHARNTGLGVLAREPFWKIRPTVSYEEFEHSILKNVIEARQLPEINHLAANSESVQDAASSKASTADAPHFTMRFLALLPCHLI
ncbi:uncharacterized protein CC84DRAFT_482286 [Paraphaeosphaeria sporulosa]|uniref:Uncharacterized protein n=1 Tax=Paraphaeosphaeria sporulosa TaxID=1460663 RepID=A0A177CS44_9PLEO|nr:uncharacterized protein CC84DRAFT_482286 [Paraphaeosphaeria sporulosa]OAG10353.1 hypothetical protein CC84DRAFT_482286 [Paraphaeosphaeria sporulosa]